MVLVSRGYSAEHLIDALESGTTRSRIAPAGEMSADLVREDESPQA